jgi:hypothetical protein
MCPIIKGQSLTKSRLAMQLATVDENEPLCVETDVERDEEATIMLHHVQTIQALLVKYADASDSMRAAMDAMQEVCFDKVNADLIHADTMASMKLKPLRQDLFQKKKAATAAAAALESANAACSKDAIYAKAANAIETYASISNDSMSDEDACRICVRMCIDEACDGQKAAKEAAEEANSALEKAKEAIHMLARETRNKIIGIEQRYRQDEETTKNMFYEALLARKRYFIEDFQEAFAAFL